MNSPWPYFTIEELTCHCGCGKMLMDNQFMQMMVMGRRHLGFALPINSGYRCPEYNNKIAKTGLKGAHTTGKACDVALLGDHRWLFLEWAFAIKIPRIGVYDNRIHVDNCGAVDGLPSPRVWVG